MKNICKTENMFECQLNAFKHKNSDYFSAELSGINIRQIRGFNIIILNLFIVLILLVAIVEPAKGQDFYYGNNRKIFLQKVDNWLMVQVREDRIDQFRNETLNNFKLKEKPSPLQRRNFLWIEERDIPIDLPRLKKDSNIVRILPCYHYRSNRLKY